MMMKEINLKRLTGCGTSSISKRLQESWKDLGPEWVRWVCSGARSRSVPLRASSLRDGVDGEEIKIALWGLLGLGFAHWLCCKEASMGRNSRG